MPTTVHVFRVARVVVWLLYVGALVGLAEVATRVLMLVPPLTPQPEVAITLHYEDPNGLVRMRPGARYFTSGHVPMIINADGLRDRRYSRTPPPEAVRIAAVGDSFTMGDGVVVEDSYPDLLEEMFAETGREVEVINFGISATNTLQQLEVVRETVLPYAPDVVVLGFNLNDYTVYDRTTFERMHDTFGLTYRVNADETVQVLQPPRTRMEWLKNEVATRLALARLVRSAWDQLMTPPPDEAAGERPADGLMAGHVPDEIWSRVNQALVEMAALVEAHGARFVVLVIPAMTELPRPHPESFRDYPFSGLHERLGQFLTDAGIDWLDVLSRFGDRSIRSVTASRYDPHFNREGNAIIAGALRDHLVDRGMIQLQNP